MLPIPQSAADSFLLHWQAALMSGNSTMQTVNRSQNMLQAQTIMGTAAVTTSLPRKLPLTMDSYEAND